MKDSGFLSLTPKDALKGFIVAFGTVVLSGVVATLETGKIPDLPTLKALAITGLCAGAAYLGKNLFTNSNDQFAKKEPKTP